MDKFHGWLVEKDGDLYKCKCEKYANARSDNFKRHIQEKHLKKLKVCVICNATLTASALSRHKKFHCSKEKAVVQSDQIPIGMTTPPSEPSTPSPDLSTPSPEPSTPSPDLNTPSHDLNTSLSDMLTPSPIDQKQSLDENAFVQASPTIEVKDYQVEAFNVRFEHKLDGTVLITHDDIEIGGFLFRLAPKLL